MTFVQEIVAKTPPESAIDRIEAQLQRLETLLDRFERIVGGWKNLPPAVRSRLRRLAAAQARASKRIGAGKDSLSLDEHQKAQKHPDLNLTPDPYEE